MNNETFLLAVDRGKRSIDKLYANCYCLLTMANDDIVPGFDDEKHDSLGIILQRVVETDKYLVLNLAGYIDAFNSVYFKKCVQKAIEAGFVKLIFQCKELVFISSDGVFSFLYFLEQLKPKGGDLVLFDVQPMIFEVFLLFGVSNLNIKDNLDDSISFLNSCEAEGSFSGFPKIFRCKSCANEIKVIEQGRCQCSACETVFVADNNGKILLSG